MRASALCVAFLAVSGLATNLFAQGAPSSAQVWDVRWVVDSAGAFAEGPGATAVGITLMARVGILPNSTSTANFGISRVGGAGSATSGFRVTFADPVSEGLGLSQGRIAAGETGDQRNLDSVTGQVSPTGVPTLLRDTSGQPLRGSFAPFRGSFSPQAGPLFLGSNTDPGNGAYFNPATGPLILANLVGSRAFNFGSEGSGPQGAATAIDADPTHLVGELTPLYRVIYTPSPGGERTINGSVVGASGFYIVNVSGIGIGPGRSTLPNVDFSFQVPGPGGLALGACAFAVLPVRRRSARS